MADAHPVAIGRNCNSKVAGKLLYWTALQKHLSITATTAIVAGSRIGRTPDDVAYPLYSLFPVDCIYVATRVSHRGIIR